MDHKVCCLYVRIYVDIYICILMWVCVSLVFIYVSGFPIWYTFMRGHRSDRGTQVNWHDSEILVDKIATAVTTSAFLKYINELKIIWNYLLQKYNRKNISCYYLFKLLSDLAVDFQQEGCLLRNLLNLYSGLIW